MSESRHGDLQTALGGAYTIERELGRGGMATVYLARDTKHQRAVALKVLLPDLAASLGPERFRREITTAAQLQHPHILGVFDSGETSDGQLWFTMPFVQGESLRDRLRRERQLPLADVLRITREIADALDYAHEANVVHRDIKPENILLTKRGDALLADFGIARTLSEGTGTGESPSAGLTMTGLAVGTPQYMSPEQASGERGLDARSDVYALGAVCYEMLAGEPPFSGTSQQAVIAKMMSTDAPSVRVLRPGVPPAMDEALARALSRVPADRWTSAGEFARAMDTAEQQSHVSNVAAAPQLQPAASAVAARKRIPVAALALVLGVMIGVGLLFAWRAKSGSAGDPSSGAVRLAVLPFDNLGDSSDAYFADGVTDAVRGKLSGIAGLEVIGSSSSGQYRHTTKTPQQIGAELGIRYMLVGKVRWEKGANGASRVQVSPELLDVRTAAQKWAEPFNAPLTDVFQVQADIADRVAHKLEVALTPAAQQTIAGRPTNDLVAYDAYLRALDVENTDGSTFSSWRRSTALTKEATAHDPTFALAWSQLGRTYALLYNNATPTPALADSAERATARGLALAPNLAATHVARSVYYADVPRDLPKALSEAEAALALEPRNPQVLSNLAAREWALGKSDAAITHLETSLSLDPRNAVAFRNLAENQLRLKHFAEATATLDRAKQLRAGWIDLYEDQALVDLQQGNLAGARAELKASMSQTDSITATTYFANYFDLVWVLDSAEQRLALSLGPDHFDGDRGVWAIVRTQIYALHGDQPHTRMWADSARIAFDEQVRANPGDAQRLVFRGLSAAYEGRCADAIADGKRSTTYFSTDATISPYVRHQLARIYMLCSEKDKAMELLEPLLRDVHYLTPAWLKIDPMLAGLRGNARFDKLVAGA